MPAPDWCWFEEELSYDNAKLAHALILSGHATGQPAVFETGLQALRWLTELQISEKGHFRPIGSNGFYRRGGIRANFDQQPIEAQATVSACLEAYRTTSDFWWYEQAQRAFDWFIGWNDLGLELYSPESGGCRRRAACGSGQREPRRGVHSGLPALVSGDAPGTKHGDKFQGTGRDLCVNLMKAEPIHVRRTSTLLKPDQSRVLLRPFTPGDSQRVGRIIARIMLMPEETVGALLEEIPAEFYQRHQQILSRFRERFEQVARDAVDG